MFNKRGPNPIKAAAKVRREKPVVEVEHHRKVQFEVDGQVYEYNSEPESDGEGEKVKMHEVFNGENHFVAVAPSLSDKLEAEDPDLARKVTATVEAIKMTRHPQGYTGLAPDGDGYKLKLLGDKGDARVFSNTIKGATDVSCSADLKNAEGDVVEKCNKEHPKSGRYVLTVFTSHDPAGHMRAGKARTY